MALLRLAVRGTNSTSAKHANGLRLGVAVPAFHKIMGPGVAAQRKAQPRRANGVRLEPQPSTGVG